MHLTNARLIMVLPHVIVILLKVIRELTVSSVVTVIMKVVSDTKTSVTKTPAVKLKIHGMAG